MRRYSTTFIIVAVLLFLIGCTTPDAHGRAGVHNLRPGNHTLTMQVDGRERSYILHVPPQARNAEPLPLIVVLHGSYGSGRKMQIGLGFDAYANQRGFLTAYPDAYQDMRWNDGRETLASSHAGIDDVAFLVAMVADVATHASLDRSRVYVTGASNGGMMSYRLGCETSGVFAGIAPVISNIPLLLAADCAPQAPIDVLSINGTVDPFIPYAGGEVCAGVRVGCEGGTVLSATESIGHFAQANGCGATPHVTQLPAPVADGTSVERYAYLECSSGAAVQLYAIHGGGHAWPPRSPQLPSGGPASANLDATEVIVDFFLR